MIDLAEHQAEGYIPLKAIARRQDISGKISGEHSQKSGAEPVSDRRARKGRGLPADKAARAVYRGSILRLTEGSLAPVACLEQEPVECPRRAECRTLPMWRKLNALVQDYLDGVTLADLTAEAQSADHYVI